MRKFAMPFLCVMSLLMLSATAQQVQVKQSAERLASALSIATSYFDKGGKSSSNEEVALLVKEEFLKLNPTMIRKPVKPVKSEDAAREKLEGELQERLKKEYPLPSAEELQKEAEKAYPLYERGEKVKVVYMGANQQVPQRVIGYYRGKTGGYIRIDSMTIRIQQMKGVEGNEVELLKFDEEATREKRIEFCEKAREAVLDKRLAAGSEYRRDFLSKQLEAIAEENEANGYTLVGSEWMDLDNLILHAVREAREEHDTQAVRSVFREMISEKRPGETVSSNVSQGASVGAEMLLLAQTSSIPKEEPKSVKSQTNNTSSRPVDVEPVKSRQTTEKPVKPKKTQSSSKVKEVKTVVETQPAVSEEPSAEDKEKALEEAKGRTMIKDRLEEMKKGNRLMDIERRSKIRKILIVGCSLIIFVLIAGVLVGWYLMKRANEEQFVSDKMQVQKAFWGAVSDDPEHFKYVAYIFPSSSEARAALEKLSYMSMDASGELICSHSGVRFGTYKHQDGMVAFIGGLNFSYVLWQEASQKMAACSEASYFKVSAAPTVNIDIPDVATFEKQNHVKMQDMGTEDVTGNNGEVNHLVKFRTADREIAIKFLDAIDVHETGVIAHVETSEGIVCKDENGVFQLEA